MNKKMVFIFKGRNHRRFLTVVLCKGGNYREFVITSFGCFVKFSPKNELRG